MSKLNVLKVFPYLHLILCLLAISVLMWVAIMRRMAKFKVVCELLEPQAYLSQTSFNGISWMNCLVSCVPFGLKHAVLEIAHGVQQAHFAGSLSQSQCVKQHNKYPDYSPGVNGASTMMLGSKSMPRTCHLLIWIPLWSTNTTMELATLWNIYKCIGLLFRLLSRFIRTEPLWKLLLAAVSRLLALGHKDCAVTKTSADPVKRRWWDANSCTASQQNGMTVTYIFFNKKKVEEKLCLAFVLHFRKCWSSFWN